MEKKFRSLTAGETFVIILDPENFSVNCGLIKKLMVVAVVTRSQTCRVVASHDSSQFRVGKVQIVTGKISSNPKP